MSSSTISQIFIFLSNCILNLITTCGIASLIAGFSLLAVLIITGPISYHIQKFVINLNKDSIFSALNDETMSVNIMSDDTNLVVSRIYKKKPQLRMVSYDQYKQMVYSLNNIWEIKPILVKSRGVLLNMKDIRSFLVEFRYKAIKNNKTLKMFTKKQDVVKPISATIPPAKITSSATTTPSPAAKVAKINFFKQLKHQLETFLAPPIPRTVQSAEECIICLDEYRDSDKVVVLPCKHFYHTCCIERCGRVVCPTCQFPINSVKFT